MQPSPASLSPQRPAVHNSLRTRTRSALIHSLAASGALERSRRTIAAQNATIVLTLHRVVPDHEQACCRSPQGMVLRESLFVKLLSYLDRKTHVVNPHNLESHSNADGRPNILLTFDDGWLDNYDIAHPHLLAANMRALFFIVTSRVGRHAPFWPEALHSLTGALESMPYGPHHLDQMLNDLAPATQHSARRPPAQASHEELLSYLKQFPAQTLEAAIEATGKRALGPQAATQMLAGDDWRERLLSWDQLNDLLEQGHAIGSHSHTHALLPQLTSDLQNQELMLSREKLLDHLPRLDARHLALAYPNGSVNSTTRHAAADAGYHRAFTTAMGLSTHASDSMLIPRINLWDGTLTDSHNNFSENHLEYSLFWRALHANA